MSSVHAKVTSVSRPSSAIAISAYRARSGNGRYSPSSASGASSIERATTSPRAAARLCAGRHCALTSPGVSSVPFFMTSASWRANASYETSRSPSRSISSNTARFCAPNCPRTVCTSSSGRFDAKRDVGGELGERGLGEPEPELERAAAAPHVERVVDPRLPGRQVDIVERGVQAAVPLRELGDGTADEIAPQLERRGELVRQLGADREAMVAAVVLQQEVEALEADRRGAAPLIEPFDRGLADDDLTVLEQPVGGAAVPLRVGLHGEAGDEELALRIAADREIRAFDDDRPEAELAREERAPGDGGRDVRQCERLLAARIEDVHVGELEPRVQAEPLRLDPADAHMLAEGARHGGRDPLLVIADARQHPEPQREHRDRDGEVERREPPAGAAQPLEPPALVRRQLRLERCGVRLVEETHRLSSGLGAKC